MAARDWRKIFYPLIHSPYDCNSQPWARLMPRAKIPIPISYMGDKYSSTWAIHHLLLFKYINTELIRSKVSSTQTSTPDIGFGHSSSGFTHCAITTGPQIDFSISSGWTLLKSQRFADLLHKCVLTNMKQEKSDHNNTSNIKHTHMTHIYNTYSGTIISIASRWVFLGWDDR